MFGTVTVIHCALSGYRTLRPQDSSATRHFSHRTLRHQDTLWHFGTDLKTLRHQKRGTRHFNTSAVIEEKPGHFDPGQFRWDTAPPVIRLKFRHQFCDAEVSCGWSVWLPTLSSLPVNGGWVTPRYSPGSSTGVLGCFDSGGCAKNPNAPGHVLGSVAPDVMPSQSAPLQWGQVAESRRPI